MAHRELIVDKRYEEYRQKVHTDKLKNMKPAIDNSSPATYSHLSTQRKRIVLESERLSKIERENALLLKKMSEIEAKPSKVDNHNPDFDKYRKSLNAGARRREQEKIQKENEAFLKRMLENPPQYSKINFDKEKEKQLAYLKNSAKFPVMEHHVSPGKGKKTEDDMDDDEEDSPSALDTLTPAESKKKMIATFSAPAKMPPVRGAASPSAKSRKKSKPAPKKKSTDSDEEEEDEDESEKEEETYSLSESDDEK